MIPGIGNKTETRSKNRTGDAHTDSQIGHSTISEKKMIVKYMHLDFTWSASAVAEMKDNVTRESKQLA